MIKSKAQLGRRWLGLLGVATIGAVGMSACTLPRARTTSTTQPTAQPQIQVTIVATPAATRAAGTTVAGTTATGTAATPVTTVEITPSATVSASADLSTTVEPTGAVAATGPVRVRLEPLVEGLDEPVYLTQAGNGTSVLYIVEQAGIVRTYDTGALNDAPFLDIEDRVGSSGNEQGLLSIAFSPNYAANGYFFVNYTNKSGDTVISRFQANEDRLTANPDSELVILEIDQPYANHNGGLLKFGPDGMLYIGMGDGGSGGDPENRAQNVASLLGKMLRIDVSQSSEAEPYTTPSDNPSFGDDARAELWAVGLRNPWRFSFDKQTGDLYIADVGQNKIEEVNFQSAGQGGLNYGWKLREGLEEYEGDKAPQFTDPVVEYPHADGCSVTGGYVYRGQAIPGLIGSYLYGDYCQGTIWRLTRDGNTWNNEELLKDNLRISSFGEDDSGELYVIDHTGSIYKVMAE